MTEPAGESGQTEPTAQSLPLKLIVGLGNPGQQYTGTRHNVGFEVIAELAERWQCGRPQQKCQAEIREAVRQDRRILLVTPLTFMNQSGQSVQQISRFFRIAPEEIVVVCDDMNLPNGQLRWRASGSGGGQKGLADILLRLGTDKVPRLRIGIGRPPGQMDATAWVLGRFRSEERAAVEIAVRRAVDSIEYCLDAGLLAVMSRFNQSSS